VGCNRVFLTGTLKGYDQTPRFREIKVPTLFTAGKYDECRPETARMYQGMVSGAEVRVFKMRGIITMWMRKRSI
jgi:proline iminopeptidase